MSFIEASTDGLILGEISAVQGAMRRNARWASSASALSAYGSSPNPNSDALSAHFGLRDKQQARRSAGEDEETREVAGSVSLSSFATLRSELRDSEGAFLGLIVRSNWLMERNRYWQHRCAHVAQPFPQHHPLRRYLWSYHRSRAYLGRQVHQLRPRPSAVAQRSGSDGSRFRGRDALQI